MTVNTADAPQKGVHVEHGGTDYLCGKGCMFDFQEDTDRYLDPSYRPSM
jgi:hypothetical protein